MMKKIFLFLCIFIASYARHENNQIQGTIVEIYDNNKTITIDSIYNTKISIKILPNTKIIDECNIISKFSTFKNLKIGDFIKVKNYSRNNLSSPIANRIFIDCYTPRAY
ncbi:hypothetical protein KJQ75_03980 [Campylobacter lari]|uniref:hypothetical protein n=1 Tax=Campylobacter lari TaxID=201 RepID=UPI00126F6C61|nr:hypothetical protein [Campylobacter lari]MBT0816094.1 hypothetical protein [Campylobacter lari]MBT0828000.1 hypothetical protein [Campylobacter lari]